MTNRFSHILMSNMWSKKKSRFTNLFKSRCNIWYFLQTQLNTNKKAMPRRNKANSLFTLSVAAPPPHHQAFIIIIIIIIIIIWRCKRTKTRRGWLTERFPLFPGVGATESSSQKAPKNCTVQGVDGGDRGRPEIAGRKRWRYAIRRGLDKIRYSAQISCSPIERC